MTRVRHAERGMIRIVVIAALLAKTIALKAGPFYELLIDDLPYADKSSLCEDFLKHSKRIVQVVRPDGWGKSTNLDMIEKFVELETDENGHPIPEDRSINRKLFAGGTLDVINAGRRTFRPLNIAKSTEMANLGRYPTISISLKQALGNSSDEVERKMKSLVADLFNRHRYLKSNISDNNDRLDFDSYCDANFDKARLSDSLRFLSRLLYNRYARKTCIFIDDYDSPIRYTFRRLVERHDIAIGDETDSDNLSKQAELYRKVANSDAFRAVFRLFLRFFENSLQTNGHLHKALLTGVFQVRFADESDGLTNMSSFSFQDSGFFEYFGLSQREAEELLTRSRINVDSEELRVRYGYYYGGRITYNARWIRRLIWAGGRFGPVDDRPDVDRPDDRDVDVTEYLINNERMRDVAQDLIEGKPVLKTLSRTITFENLTEWIFNYLTYTGYLSSRSFGFGEQTLSVPNELVRDRLKSIMYAWVGARFNVSRAYLDSMADDLANLTTSSFRSKLRRAVTLAPELPESCYNGLVKCLTYSLENKNYTVLQLNQRYNHIEPNVTLITSPGAASDGGRIWLKPSLLNRALSIDFKYVSDPERMQAESEIRLQQFDGKLLNTNLKNYTYIGKILKLVLIFAPKQLLMHYMKDTMEGLRP